MKRILNESGHERNRNAGDEAYFAAMVDGFRKYLGEHELQITAFSDRPERDRDRYGVETVYSGGSLFKTLGSFAKIVRAIMNCDVYVWGAGQILRDNTGIKSPLYRVNAILHFREVDVWRYIRKHDLPYCELYKKAYKTLGCEPCTKPYSFKGERGGRSQDKDEVMIRLRHTGYF